MVGEVQVMRKLSAMQTNSFTPKLIDLILATEIAKEPELQEKENLFIVMEHIQSDLKKVLRSTDSIDFKEEHIRVIMYNTLAGLNYLHSANVIHRDIKPSNILVDKDSQVKICDYGFARSMPTKFEHFSTNDSTPESEIVTAA